MGPEWSYYPSFLSEGTAGVDLRAAIDYPQTIPPMSSRSFSTGLKLRMPKNIKAEIKGRSGLAFNHNIIAFNGLIDQNYNYTIKVLLINLGRENYTVIPNERIAQLVFSKHQAIKFLPLRRACESDIPENEDVFAFDEASLNRSGENTSFGCRNLQGCSENNLKVDEIDEFAAVGNLLCREINAFSHFMDCENGYFPFTEDIKGEKEYLPFVETVKDEKDGFGSSGRV